MRSTMASAAARPAAIWSWPGWPNTTPVMVVRLPSIQRTALKAKQPPAAVVEPDRLHHLERRALGDVLLVQRYVVASAEPAKVAADKMLPRVGERVRRRSVQPRSMASWRSCWWHRSLL